jgi:replicative DNA helicase
MAVAGENDMVYIMIDIAKQRQGRTGKAGVYFHPETMTYTGVSREGI